MADIIIMKTTGKSAPKVEIGQGEGENLIKGPYKTKTWNHFTGEEGRLYSGIWEFDARQSEDRLQGMGILPFHRRQGSPHQRQGQEMDPEKG